MKKELEFHPEVISDIKDSYRWYDNKLEGLGERFLNELESAYIAIENFLILGQLFSMDLKDIF